jgi:hypothetical protein
VYFNVGGRLAYNCFEGNRDESWDCIQETRILKPTAFVGLDIVLKTRIVP